MILTDKNTITNRYIRKKISQYKKKKAQIVTSEKAIKGVELHRKMHPFIMLLLRTKSKLCGLTYEFINEKRLDVKDEECAEDIRKKVISYIIKEKIGKKNK